MIDPMQALRNIAEIDGLSELDIVLLLRSNRGLLTRIAEKHGVSVSTVSRVLWGKQAAPPHITRDLRAALRRARKRCAT